MEVYNLKLRTVRSVAPHSSPPVDLYLEEDDVERIYEVWGEGVQRFNWEVPITLRGGIKTITMDMIRDIPREELEDIFYKRRTQKIMEALKHVS